MDKYLTLMYLGHSLYYQGNYREAENRLKQGLLCKRLLTKSKNHVQKLNDQPSDQFPEIEVKYKMARCFYELRNFDEATTMLQSIPVKQRPAKVNALLGQIALYQNNYKVAIAAYKEVIKECPLALEAQEKLLEMGVNGSDLKLMILESKPTV